MKKLTYIGMLAIASITFVSCGGDEANDETKEGSDANHETETTSETSESSSSSSFSSDLKNEITTLKYMGADQAFDQKYVYANYSKTYGSYRVIYINYDKSEDSDYGSRTGDQTKIIVFLHNPVDGEFKPGTYTAGGDENGMNRGFAQIETADGTMSINTAVEDPGYIEITAVTDEQIAGEYHLKGKLLSDGSEFEISGSFNTKHEAVN